MNLSPRTALTAAEMADIPSESRDLAADLRATITGEVRFDGWSRSLYSTDASLYQIQPIGVVIPRTLEDVQATVSLAAKRGVPVLARGSGSSLAGQAVGAALVLDFSKNLDRVLGVDLEARSATVEPGITVAALNHTLAPLGLMLGPDPASADRATVGGAIANNASGSHSILYGMMADHVLAADVLLADGSPAHLEAVELGALDVLGRRAGLEGALYRALPELARAVTPAMFERWPRHWRRASGYNLDRLVAPFLPPASRTALNGTSPYRPAVSEMAHRDRLNLAQLLAGSEGTLAVITSATLSLVPRPVQTAVAVLHFHSVLDACAATTEILEVEPSAVELLDKQLMDLARRQPKWARRLHFVEGDPEAVLLTEFYGTSEAELAQKIGRLEAHVRARGMRGTIVRVLDRARQADVWAVRKAGLNLLMSRRGDFKPVPGIEDVSVPPERLAHYLARVFRWCETREGVHGVAVYAHASAGCLHVRPLANVKTAGGVETLQAMAEMAASLCEEMGGVLSGEHGDGLSRSALNERLFGPQIYQAFREVKHAFDPHNLLNPGKVVDAPPLTDNLRMGPGYETLTLNSVFDWRADGGFAPAIEMCNGAAVCRKGDSGVMCPSFMATRDEIDSTRGRANALRNALAGRIPRENLLSDGMAEVMDLCLGCKACKSECPSSVDMARIKAEFLVHYYHENGLPILNRLMGRLPDVNRMLYRYGRPLIPAANSLLASRAFRRAQGWIGVAPERTLPLYAARTFVEAFHARPHVVAADSPAILLFHDTWTQFYEPQIGLSAVRVLEAAGYRVLLAEERACCGRPLITGGQADRARTWIDHNVTLLAPFAAQGIPIVGIEPSCILTLRDEYPALASDSRRAALLATHAFTFEEFLQREESAGRFQAIFQPQAGSALLHGHCHTRALVGDEPALFALRLAGYAVEVIPSGCCGMAGDFGYERDHYTLSRTIGEDRLLPAVRSAAQETVLVASGTSCRRQIADFTGRRALHLVEALQRRL